MNRGGWRKEFKKHYMKTLTITDLYAEGERFDDYGEFKQFITYSLKTIPKDEFHYRLKQSVEKRLLARTEEMFYNRVEGNRWIGIDRIINGMYFALSTKNFIISYENID